MEKKKMIGPVNSYKRPTKDFKSAPSQASTLYPLLLIGHFYLDASPVLSKVIPLSS